MSRPRISVRDIALCGLLTAVMLVLGYLERQWILVPGVPGVRLGLGNVALLLALCLMPARTAVLLMLLKVFLGGLLFSGLTGMLYALGGGVLSMACMAVLLHPLKKGRPILGLPGVSALAAACHMAGQLLMSRVLLGTWAMLVQTPLLLAAGTLSGVLTGVIATGCLRGVQSRRPAARSVSPVRESKNVGQQNGEQCKEVGSSIESDV